MTASTPPAATARGGLLVAEYVRMSTDHQKYSIDNQSALIHAYAEANGMRIVQTYADSGRTGLTIKDRPGLSRLLADVLAGGASFEAVLVYDVSRWGRFQDTDESAHYEFLCRRAGIRVIYCAEQFTADGTPFSSVLKALKRAMAGEYSRELSVKVAAGKARLGSLGFRVGGIAGYGLRRQVLEYGTNPGLVLRDHQRKSIQTDRVTLVPGPPEEIALIRRMYRDYIYLRRSERRIAEDLNAEGLTFYGRPWSRNLVRTILANEKYIGNNIVGQFCQRLRTPQVLTPPEKWVRCDGAFTPIVPRALFDAAARVRRFNEKSHVSREEIVRALAVVLKREGKLTASIISAAPELPSANTVEARFGTLGQAYKEIGYRPPSRYQWHAVNRALMAVKGHAEDELLQALNMLGLHCARDSGVIRVGNGETVQVLACRHQQPRSWLAGWRIAYQRHEHATLIVAVRLKPGNAVVQDVLTVPRSVLSELPLFIQAKDEKLIAPFRHASPIAAARALQAMWDEGGGN